MGVLNAIHDFIMLKEQSMCVVWFRLEGSGVGGTVMKMQEMIKTTSIVSVMGRIEF
jgi:hypothetical protein